MGGFLGLGRTTVAVPWLAFQLGIDGSKPKYLLDATRERLEKAPRVERKNYERVYRSDVAESALGYWDVEWVVMP